jgi:hypothetical protein
VCLEGQNLLIELIAEKFHLKIQLQNVGHVSTLDLLFSNNHRIYPRIFRKIGLSEEKSGHPRWE